MIPSRNMTPELAYYKCEFKINKKLEPYFIKDPEYAYYYARIVIQGRWIEAEQYIINNSFYAYCYARHVIKGKLPENMHNMMLIHANEYAKEYFDFIK